MRSWWRDQRGLPIHCGGLLHQAPRGARRADDAVVSDRVAARVVEEVGPLVDSVGAGLPRQYPLVAIARRARVRDAARNEDATDLVERDARSGEILADDEVGESVDVRQPRSDEAVDGDLPVRAELADSRAGLRDVRHAAVEAVYLETRACPERDGQLPVAAADMDDEPSADAGGREDLGGVGGVEIAREKCGEDCDDAELSPHAEKGAAVVHGYRLGKR